MAVCIEPGCSEPRYVQPNGKVRPRCPEHHRTSRRPYNRAFWVTNAERETQTNRARYIANAERERLRAHEYYRAVRAADPEHLRALARARAARDGGAHASWVAAKTRTSNPACKDWPRYGGRGIGMAPEWLARGTGYSAFLAHIGPRPPGTTLDRIDGSRGYEPGNVRWATPSEQAFNRRPRVAA
jgi:hypothetical protein